MCFALVLVENKENWAWFLCLLLISIDNVDDLSIPLISDRQKGLIATIREVFLGKVHGNCAHHLHANVKKNHGKSVENCFWGLVYAYTRSLVNYIPSIPVFLYYVLFYCIFLHVIPSPMVCPTCRFMFYGTCARFEAILNTLETRYQGTSCYSIHQEYRCEAICATCISASSDRQSYKQPSLPREF